jgi:antirestriction protein ArdC
MNARDRTAEGGEAKLDVKSEVAKTLIAAMEAGDTPWQKPWKSTAMRPTNITTSNAYRGINRILLALSGRSSNLWCTYQQAAAKGWQVRKGEKGTMIVKVVEFDPDRNERAAGAQPGDAAIAGKEEEAARRKGAALKRYWVFNAEQIDGIPQAEQEPERDFEPVAKAEAVVQALIEQTGLIVIHGGDSACYVPSLDEVRLPHAKAFKSQYDMWATKMHECAHSTMHPKRLDRSEAYARRWGDAAYSLEELTAEISSAILAGETGVPMSRDPGHVQNHASYLRSWIKAIENDSMAIFTAAKNADMIVEYLIGLEKKMSTTVQHQEWIRAFDLEHEAKPQR